MSKRLCIIDDDPTYVFALNYLLKINNLCHDTLVFNNGEQALAYFSEHRGSEEKLPHIVFLDMSMPMMDGWDFMDAYCQLKPQLKLDVALYMMSSSISKHDMFRAKEYEQITGYLIKPMEMEELVKILS